MCIIKQEEYKGYTIKIVLDENPIEPRKEYQDCLTKMIMFHKRYSLGDKHIFRPSDYNNQEELEEAIRKEYNPVVMNPIRMYAHSGIALSLGNTYPFDCPWDSGFVGWILIAREDALKEFSTKRITKKNKEQCENILKNEFDTYNAYVQGNVYGYVVEDAHGNETDSCWGYYGETEYPIEEAKGIIDWHVKNNAEQTFENAVPIGQGHIR